MKFSSSDDDDDDDDDDDEEDYVQLRIPNSVQDTDKYLEVNFAVQMDSDSPNSQLLYYGDGTVLYGHSSNSQQ